MQACVLFIARYPFITLKILRYFHSRTNHVSQSVSRNSDLVPLGIYDIINMGAVTILYKEGYHFSNDKVCQDFLSASLYIYMEYFFVCTEGLTSKFFCEK